ncbi:pyruvate kinase [bacterium]|nr:pyruvate kinase [bacterium]
MVKTKIIATLGPSSSSYTVIRKMVMAGLDVVRLNFSHGTHEKHLRLLELVREVNKKYRRHIRIMQDLEGYRIRIGRFAGKKHKSLKKRTIVWLINDHDEGDARIIPFDYEGDLKRIKSGQLIYIDDGNIILKVKHSAKKAIKTEVVEGGILKERKGINMPGVRLPFSGLTDKDRRDIEFGIKQRVDYLAQSFVSRKKDVDTIRDLIKPKVPQCRIVAKIESREAIKNIDEIIAASDGIMIARGDMGIAVPIYQIPIIQKDIIKRCNQKKKFVITATQMLEHMTEHSRPTRAEVTDVANAILDGTDFVMLSAETAAGNYPVASVRMMNEIIKFTESYQRLLD